MHFAVSGSGDIPLICTHGWACNGEQFIELSRLLAKDFCIFRPDLPGHGQTSLNGFKPGFERYADVIVDFALQHGLKHPVLLGHSMGGVLSLMAAATGRLGPQAVINFDGSLPATEKTLAGQMQIRRWLDKPDFRKRLAKLLRKAFFLPSERGAGCEAILQTMCSAPEAVLRFLPEQIGELHPHRILPEVTAPVLFVGSAAPRFDAQEASRLLPQLRFERVPDAGHFLHVYAVNKVATVVRQFLMPLLVR
ncbi:MAG TPA: alpha/beta hydrolase [Candidatus Limnocylindrales bacterium]|nr:alpha/beta hydrolase [Candidatus Limnocylindrales bacterium]